MDLSVAGELGGWSGLAFWTLLTLLTSAFPVKSPRGAVVSVSIAPILATSILGGPLAGGLVAAVGTTEPRELRGDVPWYGTVYNHSSLVIAAVVAGFCYLAVVGPDLAPPAHITLGAAIFAGVAYFALAELFAALAVAVVQRRRLVAVVISELRGYGLALTGLVPLAWVMALAYEQVQFAVALLFALPLYTTRSAYQSVVEIRKMFTQTITALASAIDARDPSTRKHSENVSTVAVEIGQVMTVSEVDLEKLEWGGLLHDIGKIGIRDDVLMKPGRLNKAERMLMNEHPEKGRDILKDVEKLQPILPVILHHHQWYNGSGYPKVATGPGEPRALFGEEIPLLARILHVADAFEAMTAVRPYRPNPMSPRAALDELRKYSGIQFDPRVVEAFARTPTALGDWPKRSATVTEPPPAIPMIGQVGKLRARGSASAQAVSTSQPASADAP